VEALEKKIEIVKAKIDAALPVTELDVADFATFAFLVPATDAAEYKRVSREARRDGASRLKAKAVTKHVKDKAISEAMNMFV
jgi:hypothetical protein